MSEGKNLVKAKYVAFQHKQTGEYFALTLEDMYMKTVEEMLEELSHNEIGITIFNPYAFGRNSYSEEKWHIKLEKSNDGMALKIETDEFETLLGAVLNVYGLWQDTMKKGVRERLGFPQIEHKTEYTQDELASDTDLDDGNTPVPSDFPPGTIMRFLQPVEGWTELDDGTGRYIKD